MSKFKDLPYMENSDFPHVQYARAAATRTPIRHAVNTARALSESSMHELIEVLEAALAFIRRANDAPEEDCTESNTGNPATSSSPLDELLGPESGGSEIEQSNPLPSD